MAAADPGQVANSFKAYDIRGRIPDELNEDTAEMIGYAMSAEIGPGPVVVGGDVRLSSPPLKRALIDGFARAGRECIDIGLCGTEEVYFQTDILRAAGGVMVTASHNPIDYNGMKLVREGARPISGDSGLSSIRNAVLNASGVTNRNPTLPRTHADKSQYVDHLLGYVNSEALKPLKIVVNAGNGGAGLVVDALAPSLPFEFIRIQHEPDGTFPQGIPNPLLPESRGATADAVRASGADMGIAWDGDFDRCFFFDETGRFIEGYYLVGLIASTLLKRHAGAKIIHDPRLVWNTIESVEAANGVPVQSKTGHAFIKQRMRAEDAIYGGEMSAHHYFRDFAYCDSGMIPWLLIGSLVSQSGRSLADLVEEGMRRFPCSGEINFKVASTEASVQNVMSRFADQNPVLDMTDGISADFGEWRFNLRASNTEPLLRLNVETRANIDLLQDRVQQISDLLNMED